MHCNDVNSNILNALQLGKVTSRYTITARVGIIQSRLYTVMDSVRDRVRDRDMGRVRVRVRLGLEV